MTQPNSPQKGVISLLIQEQLSTMSQSRINLAVPIDVRGDHPRTRGMVEVEDSAFANIDEETNVLLAPEECVSGRNIGEEGVYQTDFNMCCCAPPICWDLPLRLGGPCFKQQILCPQVITPQKRQSIGSLTSLPVFGQRLFIVSSIKVS
jgi:hypothetical protein